MPEIWGRTGIFRTRPCSIVCEEYWGGEELRYQAGVSEVSREGVPNG